MTDLPTAHPDDHPDAPPGELRPLPPWARTAYTVLNTTTAPVWAAMILAPRTRLTARLVAVATPLLAGLGITYSALLAAGVLTSDERPDVRDPDALRRAMGSPEAFLAGWTHYLAFDLFVGRWIWEDAQRRDQSARLSLLLTWMAGPAGLTLHLAQRRRAAARP
jgi:hypothetical protein